MKVAVYCRLSEEDKKKQHETDDSESIQNQKIMLLQYIMERGWELYQIYSDDDYAGSDRSRPAFRRLLADAEAGQFDIVLCKSQSRFTRELELVEKYIHGLFPIWGVRFVSVVDNADTDNKGNKKARQINGLVNEWYLEDMSESIKSVFHAKRQNGQHIGAFALYGYQKDPVRKGHLVVDEEAAAVVREVFTLFAQGYGKTAIARRLNSRRVPNPSEYKRLQGLRYQPAADRNSTLWQYSTLSHMLVNEIYLGNMVQGKYGSVSYKSKQNKPRPKEQWYRVEGTHEPVISRDLWDEVQALVRERAKPFSTGEVGLFAEKVRCMYCGRTMRSTKNRGRHYLQCASRHFDKDACVGSFVSVEALERAVLAELHRLSDEWLDWDALEAGVVFRQDTGQELRRLQGECAGYERKAEELRQGIAALYLDKVTGSITGEEYAEYTEQFKQDKTNAEALLAQGREKMRQLDMERQAEKSPRERLKEYVNAACLTREMVGQFIDYILAGKREKGSMEVPVEIHWRF